MKKIVLLLLATLGACCCFAQKEANIWCFGMHVGLDFNTNPPTPYNGAAIATSEGCASIADRITGQLLFYTDGILVWDRNHNAMPACLTTLLNGDPSSTNSGVVVPLPGTLNQYYVFTTPAQVRSFNFGNLPPTMCYSIVDMNLNSGNGDLTTLNVPVMDSSTEKIAVVGNCDRSVYWIVGHRWNCDTFYAFRLTAAGLSAPVKSKIGVVPRDMENSGNFTESIGYMKFSSDGRKLAVVNYTPQNTLQVFDFDFSTGIVSNPFLTDVMPMEPNDPFGGPYGCSFSPDNSRLYVGWTGTQNVRVMQYNMQAGSGAAILASKTVVATIPIGNVGALQNGPDGKMYVSILGSSSALDVINNPNALGTACNYTPAAQNIGSGIPMFGLPAMVESFLSPASGIGFTPPADSIRCGDEVVVAPQQGSGLYIITPAEGWDVNADSSLFRFYPDKTTEYTVVRIGECAGDTSRFTIYVSKGPIADFTVEPGTPGLSDAQITLHNMSQRAQSYSWLSNDGQLLSNTTNYTFPNPGLGQHCYTLIAADTLGCKDTAHKCIGVEDDNSVLFIPNTFTPNGDGLNDLFLLYGVNVTLNGFSIYNRYGERVFYTTDISQGWNGRFRESPCDGGSYFYMVRYTTVNGKQGSRKGDLQLIR